MEKPAWVITWVNHTTTIIIGDKFYKTFLNHFSIMEIRKIKNKKYGTLKQ